MKNICRRNEKGGGSSQVLLWGVPSCLFGGTLFGEKEGSAPRSMGKELVLGGGGKSFSEVVRQSVSAVRQP